jgi:hypothetical protein
MIVGAMGWFEIWAKEVWDALPLNESEKGLEYGGE